jgi:hypothetical protein
MSAQIGNLSAEKYRTPEERKDIFELLCEHVAQGFNLDCFVPMSFETIKRYLEVYPDEFESDKLAESERKGKLHWEGIGMAGIVGKIKDFKERTYQFVMMNKYDQKIKSETQIPMLSADEIKDELDKLNKLTAPNPISETKQSNISK